MYCGGAIFIDQASGYIHVEFQTTLTSHATLRAKDAYENVAETLASFRRNTYPTLVPPSLVKINGTI